MLSLVLTYSAAVWELSDICDMLLVRSFADAAVDCEPAMIELQYARRTQVESKIEEFGTIQT